MLPLWNFFKPDEDWTNAVMYLTDRGFDVTDQDLCGVLVNNMVE